MENVRLMSNVYKIKLSEYNGDDKI